MMKKVLSVGAVAFLGLLIATSVFAQAIPGQIPDVGIQGVGAPVSIGGAVGWLITIVRWFYTIIFIVAVFMILLSAFYFVTSGGDPDKSKKARQTLLFAVVGIVVALLAYGIVYFVQNSLAGGLAY